MNTSVPIYRRSTNDIAGAAGAVISERKQFFGKKIESISVKILKGQNFNFAMGNGLTTQFNKIKINDRTFNYIPGHLPDTYISSVFKENPPLSFEIKDKEDNDTSFFPPLDLKNRLVKWISEGSNKCTTSKDNELEIPTCTQFIQYLFNGSTEFSYNEPPICSNIEQIDVKDIENVDPFKCLAIVNADTGAVIHDMLHLGKGYCISKYGQTDRIAIQKVDKSLLRTWSLYSAKSQNKSESRVVLTSSVMLANQSKK